jgi:hypothetical protein
LKGRDLAILAAVVLLGGFALADALRSRGRDAREPTVETTRADRGGPEPQADAPANWPSGRIQGTLVFTDADDCRVRVVGLGGGRERPATELVGFCRLWAAPIGQRIAYDTGGVRGSPGDSFAVVDLRRAGVELASLQNLSGDVLWSPDAQRLAWCDDNGFGYELEVGNERPRRTARCPIAYTPEGRLAFAVGRRLVSEGRVLLVEDESLTQVHWGEDESLLVTLADGAVQRYDPTGGPDPIVLFTNRDLVPSPDNCAVLFEESGQIHLVDLGCGRIHERSFIAFDAAWSADGRWVAVAGQEQIEFHDVLTGDQRLVWPARARELDWR